MVEESKMQQGGGKESETKKMVWFHVRMWCSSTSTTNISTKRTTIYHVGKWFQFNDAEMFARAASHLSPWKMIFNCGSVIPKRPQVPHTHTQTHHLRLTPALCVDVLRTFELILNWRAVT